MPVPLSPSRKAPILSRRNVVSGGVGLFGLAGAGARASAQGVEPLTYLLPAPKEAIAFAPFTLAQRLGYYADEGLAVNFVVVPGGARVGEALARGEGDLGGASGDTPILLRARRVPVRGVALLGGHAFLTLISDRRRRVSPDHLKGLRLGVPSLADVSFYALDAQMKAQGLTGQDVAIRAAPAAELWRDLGSGDLDGFVGTVDWGVRAERSGVTLDYLSVDRFFPAMAQAILASDAMIAAQPARIERFSRATLKSLGYIRRQPLQAAKRLLEITPGSDLSRDEVARVLRLFDRHVYAGQRVPGAFERARVTAMREVYLERGLISERPAIAEIFSNAFV